LKIFTILLLITSLLSAIDINSASTSELITLHGIGPKKAEAIINYRATHCFKTVESIVEVKGIGKKTLEKNRANLKVGKCRE